MNSLFQSSGTPKPTLADSVGNALSAFWSGITFDLTSLPPGWVQEITANVTLPGTPNAASSILTSLFSGTNESFDYSASVWANAMDTHAKTVVVTITGLIPGPNGPVPAPPIIATIH